MQTKQTLTLLIDRLAGQYDYKAEYLLEILHVIQAQFHTISDAAVEQLADSLKIPRTRIIDVREFYAFFSATPQGRYQLLISDSITDQMLGNEQLIDYLSKQLAVAPGSVREDGQVSLHNTSCTGLCDQGPAGLINGYALNGLDTQKADNIVALIEQSVPLSDWPQALFRVEDNIHKKGLLLNRPIERGAALQIFKQRSEQQVLKEIELSGLRGRGGAGFNTAMKWRFCAQEKQQQRYLVCNADEGEPGTFKDRVLLNRFADQVFEGMTLCARIIGAEQGFLYLRGEYLYLREALLQVLETRRELGLLGDAVNFDIEIRLGAGAYICGEESALIESLEGKSGIPRNRPPFPVSSGYMGKPTVVNNVETFFAAAAIAVYGGEWFAAEGGAQSRGSKLLSISGDCQRPGIYEYSFGAQVSEILGDCGATEAFGVQIGGPSGTFIGYDEFDRRLGFEDLSTGGSFIVFNKSRDILAIAQNFTHFFAHESCGFCTPCRVGVPLLRKQLDKIAAGHGSVDDLVALQELSNLVNTQSHCGLGQTAANPILTTLQRFPEHYQNRLNSLSFQPGFDLDGELETARRLTSRQDSEAHLLQQAEQDE